jgi:aryl-alcohol dehydrogenase-like predicted oxidoreductase
MEYRPLGRTGLQVSALCLGTMTWGQQNSEAEGHAQMDYALDRGINFVDTAELYAIPPKPETQGSTERIIGSWFRSRGKRDKVILATKVVGRSDVMNWFRDDGSLAELSRKQILEAVDKSLKRLQTDYIDLYQLHWPDRAVSQFGSNPTVFRAAQGPEHPIHEILATLDEVVKAGKVRFIGLSNESSWGTMKFLHESETRGLPRVQSLQNACSLLNRTVEVNLAEVLLREEVSFLAYSPLGQGYLTGKYQGGRRPAGTRKVLFERLQRYETPGASEAIDKYLALAAEAGLDPVQMALQFVTMRPYVTSNIIGATSLEQLRHNIDSLDVTLSGEVVAKIDAIHQIHCNPCP